MKSNAIRKAARDQECTFNIAGVCNYDRATSVFCHLPSETSGMGLKSTDLSGAIGCSSCHDAVDGRVQCEEYQDNKWFYNYRAMNRTWELYLSLGLITVKGAK